MEAILITNGETSNYFLTKNGSIVHKYNGIDYCFIKNTIDFEKEGILVYYKNNKHCSGNHIRENNGYDIVGPCLYLSDRICTIESNIKIGHEFIYNGNQPGSTKGETYKVEELHIYPNSFSIDYYNDRNNLASIYDLKDIIIRELSEN